ncbi:MAG: metalloregulator ArsR/SmtB family transcription factor [Candidatus Pacearchaeota archaeon]
MFYCKSHIDFFRNLSNEKNYLIINVLLSGPKTVSEIEKETKIEQSNISHCLKKLYECKIVYAKKKGKYRLYHINKKIITKLFKIANKHASKKCSMCLKKSKNGEI